MAYLDRAIKDGYAYLIGSDGSKKITYVTSDNRVEKFDDPEEKVRAEFWAELIYKYDYPANRIKIEVVVPDRLPSDRADIVVFSDDDCKRPYIVTECKKDGVTDAEFNQAIEQGVGNATWIKLRADYVVAIAGATRRVLDVSDKFGAFEREFNILADLPKAYGKPQEYRFYKGDPDNDLKIVDRDTLMMMIKKCHQSLWGGGRLSPPAAFGELCKLIFVKISDEQKPRKKGEPYEFQIKTHEPSSKLSDRINKLYEEQKARDPEVFTDSIKVDDRVLRTVVSHLESINLNKTDLDVKGIAFEKFMDSFFKGDFGQYFTPRPIIEFAVNMLKPDHDKLVLDPSCGSGGFLLYSLDRIRKEASIYYEKGSAEHFQYWHDFAQKNLYGIEINDEIARVAKMNMIVHDDGHTNVISHDALDSISKMHEHNTGFGKERFDIILTNPPFGSTINQSEKPYLASFELGKQYDKTGKIKIRKNQSSEILFIERIWEFLKYGTGMAAIVLPDGVLTNGSSKYVRNFILERFQLLCVVSLPKDAFAHFGAGVNASIVFLRKKYQNEWEGDSGVGRPVFMAKPRYIGYDATGSETKENQFPTIVSKYHAFSEGQSIFDDEQTGYLVPFTQIEDRIDVDHYAPDFIKLKTQIERSEFPIFAIEEICDSIKSGFAAGKQDQADFVSDDKRVPHIRPFNITPNGQLTFETQKYVPIEGLTSADFCGFGEVLFNNTNSLEWVGKSTVFDSSKKCAASNHITRLKLKGCADPYYVATFFNMLLRLGYWEFLCTNFNNQSGVNIETLKKVKIILPSLPIQQEYAKAIVNSQLHAEELRKQAELEVETARIKFENRLLGGSSL